MARNNKNRYTFKNNGDVVRRARELNKSKDIYFEDKKKSTIADIENIASSLVPGQNIVINSNVGTINDKNNIFKNKEAIKDYEYSAVTEAIRKLHDNKFYDVVSGKISTAEDILAKSLENTVKLQMIAQAGKSNESLYSFSQKMKHIKEMRKNNGTFVVYDLETLGAQDAHGIWRPTHITEFSMHQYGVNGEVIDKTDILIGWQNKDEAEHLMQRIRTAIKDGTIEYDDELRVAAHRLSLYGDDGFDYEFDAEKKVFKTSKFIDSELGDYRDLKRIEKGKDFFLKIGKEIGKDEHGVPLDIKMMMETLANNNKLLKENPHAMLVDFNGSMFDKPIIDSFANKFIEQHPSLKNLFGGESFSLHARGNKHLDVQGAFQHFRSNFSSKSLLGDKILDIKENRLNRQEHYVKAFYSKLFKDNGLKPHEASSDVTALSYFLTQNAEGLGMPLIDYIAKELDPVIKAQQVHELNPGEHILKAKKYNNGTYSGKNMLNFAIDKTNNNIYTADNHMIRNGVVQKKDFNVGAGINEGAFYTLGGVREIINADEYASIIGKHFPQYGSSNLFAVTLDMVTTDEYKGTRLDNLSQVVILNGETELQAFMANTFDVVAKRGDNGEFKVLDRDAFDIRRYKMIKGKPVFEDVHDNWAKTDKEIIEAGVRHENKKILTSRAENAINGDNAYRKIGQALEIQKAARKHLNRNISNRELNTIMAERVAKGQMPIGISEAQRLAMQRSVRDILEWKGDLYDSTIDNMSTYMDNITDNEAYYTKLLGILNEHETFKNENTPAAVKKNLFKRADRHARESLASGIYDNESRIKKSVLGDEALETSLSRFKSMYEIDLSKMSAAQRVLNYDITQANPTHLLRLNLGKDNLDYELVKGVRKAIHGDKKFMSTKEREAVEKRDFRKFIDMMLQDEEFDKSLKENFREELIDIARNNADYNTIAVAQRMVKQMSTIKKADPFSGIISKDLYMKELSSSSGYVKALNGKEFLDSLDGIVNEMLDNTSLTMINGSKTKAKTFVEKNLLHHYIPSTQATQFAHKKAKEEMTDYLTELVYSIDKIGASISLNDYGDITMHDSGKAVTLNLPRIKADMDSPDTWYLNTGNMNNKLSLHLNTKSINGGYGIDLGVQTTFAESVGTFPLSNKVQSFYEKQGASATKDSMDYIETLVNSGKKRLIKNPTINSFNANDANSNRLINISGIKNVLPEIFGENGRLNYLVANKKFLDSNLQDVLMKDIAKHLKRGDTIEELDAYMINSIIKNAPHILEIIADKAGVEGTEIGELIKQISFTTNDKQMSSLTGIVGDMPLFSPQAAFDNVQRPPVIAAGNAIPIRMENAKKLQEEGSGVLAGNLISAASIDKQTMKHVAGVGQTTTDVMMDIAYIDTNALDIIKNNRIDQVLTKNNVEGNQKQRILSMFTKMNTYEQERHLDGRIAERLYGLMPSKIQNISASKDLVSPIHLMDKDAALKQLDSMIDVRGNMTIDKAGLISYKSATGKFVRRGEDVIKILGYGDKIETISPNVKNGVFLHKYVKSNGMVLTDDEITKIVNKNKDLFMSNGKLVDKVESSRILEKLLGEKYSANGSYRIHDVSAAGYIKPTTSSVEKGMTNLNYMKTGSYDKKIDDFFKSIGMQDVSRQSVLTDEGIDAILAHVGIKKVSKALKVKDGFGTVAELKAAINKERNAFNEMVMDKVFGGKFQMIVNDGVAKHGGSGQMQFGILNKAIDNLAKHRGSYDAAVKEVADIINSDKKFQFLETRNLNTSDVKSTGFKVKDGRLIMDDVSTKIDNLSVSHIERLENLITEIDKRTGGGLVHTEGYIRKWNDEKKVMEVVPLKESGQKIFGDWTTEEIDGKKVFISPITKESVKLLPDVETQTGTESRYFELQETLKKLRAEKNSTKSHSERLKKQEQISAIEQELKNYESVSKRMSIGSTEFQLLERIKVTEQHAQEIQALIESGEEGARVVDELLASNALRGKIIRNAEGRIEIDETLKSPVLNHWLQRFKGQLTYNPLQEDLLTQRMVETDYKHLRQIWKNAKKHGYQLGVESAEKIHMLDMADMAVKYNAEGKFSEKNLIDAGFEKKRIDDIIFETDEIAKKNLLIDLGSEFDGKNRYIAIAGTGHKLGEEDEILTNGQKELRSLAHRYEEWKLSRHDDEAEAIARAKVEEQAQDTITAIRKSIYGKNAYADQLNKVQVDDVNYRYKASGAVTSELATGLDASLRRQNSKLQIDDDLLSTREINGQSLKYWHEKGVHYDYKFVSLEAMENMGMFKDDVMKAYGANSKQDMISILKKTGTMDMTDRYPNNKNDSLLLTHVFLDTDLVGNETKVAGVSGLKMLLDHDGDSVSSFALRYKTDKGQWVDYGMFVNNPEYVKKVSQEAYEEFSNMQATTTTRALTENKKWLEDVNNIIVKDAIKNSEMGDLSKTALVPGGQSILGKIAPAAISHLEGIDETAKNLNDVNAMLSKAASFIEDGSVNTSIKASDLNLDADKSEKVLDKALTVMQEANAGKLISDDDLKAYESLALKKVAIDKASVASHAKTGVATTGAINVATNSIKKSVHDTLIDTDPTTVDIFRSIFDIPEQEAISSKKIISAYDDMRARDMTDILGKMFTSNNARNYQLSKNDMVDFRNWFETHAKGGVEGVFDEFKGRLSKDVIERANTHGKFDAMMNLVETELQSLSNNEFFQGRRLHYKTRGEISSGASNAIDDFSSTVNRVRGMADEGYKIRQQEMTQIKEQAAARVAHAGNFHANSSMVRQTSQAANMLSEALTSGGGIKLGNSLSMAALGLAGGLMAAGYASGNPLNDKQASQVVQEGQQPVQTMSIPDFMDKQGGYVTGNTQQGYIINIKADTKKGRKHMQRIMKQAAEASVGGAVSVNMNIRDVSDRGITDADIENFLDRHL